MNACDPFVPGTKSRVTITASAPIVHAFSRSTSWSVSAPVWKPLPPPSACNAASSS
jgi:hypothetical protein